MCCVQSFLYLSINLSLCLSVYLLCAHTSPCTCRRTLASTKLDFFIFIFILSFFSFSSCSLYVCMFFLLTYQVHVRGAVAVAELWRQQYRAGEESDSDPQCSRAHLRYGSLCRSTYFYSRSLALSFFYGRSIALSLSSIVGLLLSLFLL